MTDEIGAFLRARVPDGARLICAVSGGPDSMALLRAVRALPYALTCAHFHHGLRRAADDDERFVRDFCAQAGIPFVCGRANVATERCPGESVETAARRLRYDFLLGIDPDAFVLTAHTADDNLETMLMHLIRGASLRGLAGIPPERGRILRPMLTCTRADVLAYLKKTGTPFRTDESNDTDDYLRNRVRHRVIPLLRQENPSIAESAQRAAARLREEDALLSDLAREALDNARAPGGLSCRALCALPDALTRRVLLLFLREQAVPELSARQIDALCALVRSQEPGAALSLCGEVRARREYDTLRIVRAETAGAWPETPLAVPGVTRIAALGLTVRCRVGTWPDDAVPGALAVRLPDAPVFLRPRRTGDTIRLPGGSRTLKKWMIDRKIPAAQRGRVPILADSDGVIAVPGLAIDQTRIPCAGAPALYIQTEKDGTYNELS